MFHYGISPKNFDKEQKNKLRSDEILGHHIEGKFAQQQKRSQKKVIAKLSKTSTTAIAITFFTFLVINLSTLLKEAFSLFLYFLSGCF